MNNLLLQQRNVEDKSGIGYSYKTENQPAKFSTNQDVSLIKETLTKHKENLKKIHEPLNEAQRLLSMREKGCESLEREVSRLRKEEGSPNSDNKVEFGRRTRWPVQTSNTKESLTKPAFTNSAAPRRSSFIRYQNTFFGNCYNFYRFCHKAFECTAPMRRKFDRNEGKEYLANIFMNQTKNSFSLLSNEEECSKCNNFGHTIENCRLR